MQALTRDQIKTLLEAVAPEYKRISEAPRLSAVEAYEDQKGMKAGTLTQSMRQKQYKSMDYEGNVYVIHNPAFWDYTTNEKGQRFYIRPEAKKIMTRKQAVEAAGSTDTGYERKFLSKDTF